MYPPQCNESCVTKRFRLYIFYGVLFFTLIILALTHFIVFVVYRRRSKEQTNDYIARKQEYFASSLTDLRLEKEARDTAAQAEIELAALSKGGESIGDESDTGTECQYQRDEQQEDSLSRLTSASSLLLKRMGVEGLLPGLERIDEENVAEISRCSTSSTLSRGRSAVKAALHEPVIVTVATVSAIFAEEAEKDQNGENGEELVERKNSVLDISDIIDSPRKTAPQQQNHFDFRKSGDSTLSAHFSRRGSDHSSSKISNHRDLSHHERSIEESE